MTITGTILVILLLWVLISVPLTIIGGIFGRRHGVSDFKHHASRNNADFRLYCY